MSHERKIEYLATVLEEYWQSDRCNCLTEDPEDRPCRNCRAQLALFGTKVLSDELMGTRVPKTEEATRIMIDHLGWHRKDRLPDTVYLICSRCRQRIGDERCPTTAHLPEGVINVPPFTA